MAGDAADGTATASAGTADKNVGEFGFDAPGFDGVRGFGEWKGQRTVENVAAVMAEFLFDIERSLGFEAGLAVMSAGEAILDWFGEIAVETVEAFACSLMSDGIIVGIE